MSFFVPLLLAGGEAGAEGLGSPPPCCPAWAKRLRMSFLGPSGEAWGVEVPLCGASPRGRSRKRTAFSFFVSQWVGRFLRLPKMGVFSAPAFEQISLQVCRTTQSLLLKYC